MTSSAESAGMNEDIMKLGLLMEGSAAQQRAVEQHLDRLQECTSNLDGVVREEIRRTLIEELRELMAEGKAAAQALRRLRCAADWRTGLFGLCLAAAASTVPWIIVWRTVPTQAEIERLRAERAELSADVARLRQLGGAIDWRRCGAEQRLCVRVDRQGPAYGEQADFLPVKRP